MKSCEPTPSRLERARREGDHPISRDAVAVAAFIGSLLAVSALIPASGPAMRHAFRSALAGGGSSPFAALLTIAAAATAGAAIAAAAGATLLQTRGLSFRTPGFRLTFARAFTRDAWSGTVRALLTVGGALVAMAATVAPHPRAIAKTLAAVAAAGLCGALADLFASRAAWRHRLRMTYHEVRRELREQDGDPHVRGRRRRLHRSLLRGGVQQVRRASFVVVNPTHVAVALRYVPPHTPVPEILIRAVDANALRLRRAAAEASVPVIEDAPLARRLHAHEALGPIPPETYVAVAQIVASLQRRT